MSVDRNTLLGVLLVKRGWAQPAEVIAARQAVAVDPRRSLAQELSLSSARVQELEKLAEAALAAAQGNVQKAIDANGGAASLNPAKPFGDVDDEERTSIELDLDSTGPAPPLSASLGDDDEEESTKVLDWDRALRKSLDDKKK